jgi:hypothetical protein
MVGRLSRFSRKKLKLQRKLCGGWNVLSPTEDQRECWLLRDASILNWEEIRRERGSNPVLSSIYFVFMKKIKL